MITGQKVIEHWRGDVMAKFSMTDLHFNNGFNVINVIRYKNTHSSLPPSIYPTLLPLSQKGKIIDIAETIGEKKIQR